MKYVFLLLVILACCSGCENDPAPEILLEDVPDCVIATINQAEGASFQEFTQVLEVRTSTDVLYSFVTDECCDRGGFALNAACDTVCTFFGFTGVWLGEPCAEFRDSTTVYRLVWED